MKPNKLLKKKLTESRLNSKLKMLPLRLKPKEKLLSLTELDRNSKERKDKRKKNPLQLRRKPTNQLQVARLLSMRNMKNMRSKRSMRLKSKNNTPSKKSIQRNTKK